MKLYISGIVSFPFRHHIRELSFFFTYSDELDRWNEKRRKEMKIKIKKSSMYLLVQSYMYNLIGRETQDSRCHSVTVEIDRWSSYQSAGLSRIVASNSRAKSSLRSRNWSLRTVLQQRSAIQFFYFVSRLLVRSYLTDCINFGALGKGLEERGATEVTLLPGFRRLITPLRTTKLSPLIWRSRILSSLITPIG